MRITTAHGSGGNATRELIHNTFRKYLGNPCLDRMDDAALLPPSAFPLAFTTDSFVITPLFFPGGDIGKLAVCGTVNDLWMMGAVPRYLSVGFILEEGLELSALERIIRSMSETAHAEDVLVVAGDTKVVEGQGGLYINTAGIGYLRYDCELGGTQAKVGDKIIVSGPLGNHQACILSARMDIKNEITSDCASLGGMVRRLLDEKVNVHVLRDITRGGLATVVNEIAASSGVGMVLRENDLPVDPPVAAFCDILGLDPLYMANEGKFLCVVEAADADRALALIREDPLGSKAAIIGEVTPAAVDKPPVVAATRYGGQRTVDILYGEGLPRIC